MTALVTYFRSSLGRKYVMGITGLALAGFVLVHMMGNLLLLKGPEAYNAYGYALTHNKAFFYTSEVLLLLLFGVHMVCAVSLTLDNWAARPSTYAMTPNGDKGPELASQTMIWTGSLLAVFLVVHLLGFRFGTHYDFQAASGLEMRDIYRLARETFARPGVVIGYVVALWFLAIHLRHGFSSMFQSVGLVGPRTRPWIHLVAAVYGVIVALGFVVPPLYIFLQGS